MLSNRPYLLRAFYQWIVDSACTPILVIDANNPRCKIPRDYADGGEIVFNVAPIAVRDFKISNETAEFKASFSGVIHIISAPINGILAIYAEENGEGLFFDAEEESISGGEVMQMRNVDNSDIEPIDQNISHSQVNTVKSKPFLKLVE